MLFPQLDNSIVFTPLSFGKQLQESRRILFLSLARFFVFFSSSSQEKLIQGSSREAFLGDPVETRFKWGNNNSVLVAVQHTPST